MGMYRTSRCPYCRCTLELMQPTGINDYECLFGPPIQWCPKCHQPYKTGQSYWKIMTTSQKEKVKIRLFVSVVISILVFGGVLGTMLLYFIVMQITGDLGEVALILCPISSLSISAFIFIRRSVRSLRTLKEFDPTIFMAVEGGDLETVKSCLEADVDWREQKMLNMLLMMAISQNRRNVVEFLISEGASVSSKVSGVTPVRVAEKQGYLDLAAFLRSRGGG